MTDNNFNSITDIFKNKQSTKKAPAYKWQDLALKVINDLNIPNFKRSAVFKVCKENPENFILNALNDTKELCKSGVKWKYFFKLVSEFKRGYRQTSSRLKF